MELLPQKFGAGMTAPLQAFASLCGAPFGKLSPQPNHHEDDTDAPPISVSPRAPSRDTCNAAAPGPVVVVRQAADVGTGDCVGRHPPRLGVGSGLPERDSNYNESDLRSASQCQRENRGLGRWRGWGDDVHWHRGLCLRRWWWRWRLLCLYRDDHGGDGHACHHGWQRRGSRQQRSGFPSRVFRGANHRLCQWRGERQHRGGRGGRLGRVRWCGLSWGIGGGYFLHRRGRWKGALE